MILVQSILAWSTAFALIVLSLALVMTTIRILRGPTLADRIMGLDMLVAIAIGFIAVFSIRSGFHLYMDIAMALGLSGFLATVALARYVLSTAGSANLSERLRSQTARPKKGKSK